MSFMSNLCLQPDDEFNRSLRQNVHPTDWINPTPTDRYDLVVIGGGTAGLVVAAGAAGLGLGLKVALIERQWLGGDCLNTGCVPSKTLLRSARVIGELDRAQALGIDATASVDFAAVMTRLRRIRAAISPHDSVERFTSLGVDVFLGAAQFDDRGGVKVQSVQNSDDRPLGNRHPADQTNSPNRDRLDWDRLDWDRPDRDGSNQALMGDPSANDRYLRYRKAVIATGARAAIPEIPGLATAGYLTHETIFSLTTCPDRLLVLGGGPIGCELGQALQRLGAQVTIVQRGAQLLKQSEPNAAIILQNQLQKDGVTVKLQTQVSQVEQTPTGKRVTLHTEAGETTIEVDEILVAAGRVPNLENLNLAAVGVAWTAQGVTVNDHLQTTNPKIYAAGDICLSQKFTHAADAAARLVIQNALFSPFRWLQARLSAVTIPTVIFTDPEVAQVGLTEAAAIAQGYRYRVIEMPFERLDRAITDAETDGYLKLLHDENSDRILGATIVAVHAGEMISEVTSAIVHRLGLNALSQVIHAYPTQAECLKKAADTYKKTKLTPTTQKLLKIIYSLTSLFA